MDTKEPKRMEMIAVKECMKQLASTIMAKNSKTEALLYFQFEDLVNEAFGTAVNNSDCAGIYEDGKRMFEPWHIARKEYLEMLETIIEKHGKSIKR